MVSIIKQYNITALATARKVSVVRVILVRIFPHSVTPYVVCPTNLQKQHPLDENHLDAVRDLSN